MTSKNIAIIGGGIIGAFIAWRMSEAGASVTLFSARPGGVATPNSFAWINANWGNPEPYFKLRRAAMARWRALKEQLPLAAPNWSGSICYDLPPDELARFAAENGAWGYGVDRIERPTIAALEPELIDPPEWALKIDEEGMIEPLAVTQAVLAAAERAGARLVSGAEVTGLQMIGSQVTGVTLPDGGASFDEVILAAGAATVGLAASAGVTVPVDDLPGLLIETRPTRPLINHIIVAPNMEMRQTADGRIVAATSYNGTDPGEDPAATARAVFEDLQSRLKAGKALEFDAYRIGYRPIPKDGFSIIGRAGGVKGLYLAVTHSGVTLAPAIGDFAARELINGDDEPLLAPYRLARFV